LVLCRVLGAKEHPWCKRYVVNLFI
jgi:hypothetical protein